MGLFNRSNDNPGTADNTVSTGGQGSGLIGGTIGAVTDIGFGIADRITSRKRRKENVKYAQEQQSYDRSMDDLAYAMYREGLQREDTAVQRRVADLKAAGLSPTLAAGSAAGSSVVSKIGTKSQAPQHGMGQPKTEVGQGMMNLISHRKQFALMDKNIELMSESINKIDKDVEKRDVEIDILKKELGIKSKELERANTSNVLPDNSTKAKDISTIIENFKDIADVAVPLIYPKKHKKILETLNEKVYNRK